MSFLWSSSPMMPLSFSFLLQIPANCRRHLKMAFPFCFLSFPGSVSRFFQHSTVSATLLFLVLPTMFMFPHQYPIQEVTPEFFFCKSFCVAFLLTPACNTAASFFCKRTSGLIRTIVCSTWAYRFQFLSYFFLWPCYTLHIAFSTSCRGNTNDSTFFFGRSFYPLHIVVANLEKLTVITYPPALYVSLSRLFQSLVALRIKFLFLHIIMCVVLQLYSLSRLSFFL